MTKANLKITLSRSAAAITTTCAIFGLPQLALAQLANSPAPVEVPGVWVTLPAQSGAPRAERPVKAPAAAQQSSTPRSQPGARPAAAGPAAIDPATVSVAPTGQTQSVDQVASSVTVVTSQEIEAQQRRTANDVLRSVPGVNVVQQGGPGALTSLFLRGTESNHTKVIIDGIDVSDPSSASRTFDFGRLTTFDLERIEVLRGPQSGLYGADALGGVVVIYTKKGEGPLQVDALVEGGSFGTFNQAVSARGSVNRFNYAFNVSHLQTAKVAVTPREILGPGVPLLENSFDNWSYSTKLGYDVSDALTFNVAARYSDSRLDFQSSRFDTKLTTTLNEQFQTRGEAVLRLFQGRLVNYFGVNYTDVATKNFSPSSTNFTDGERVKYDWRSVADLAPGVVATVGADTQMEKIQTPKFAAQESNQGGYGQLQVSPIRNLFLVGNVRFDDNEKFGAATTYRFAPSYVIEQTGTKLKGSIGTAFMAPSLSERFQDFAPFFFANPNLKPEESTGYDFGFEQAVFNNRAQFGATYFHNDITNLITSGFDSARGATSVFNIATATTSGVEIFASADVTDDLRVRADYTYTEAIDGKTGLDLKRRPRDKVTVSVGYRATAALFLTGSVTYIGPSEDVNRVFVFGAPDPVLPGYTVANIAADYKLNTNMSLIGRIDNVFDERYQSPTGFNATGIGAYAGIKFRN